MYVVGGGEEGRVVGDDDADGRDSDGGQDIDNGVIGVSMTARGAGQARGVAVAGEGAITPRPWGVGHRHVILEAIRAGDGGGVPEVEGPWSFW